VVALLYINSNHFYLFRSAYVDLYFIFLLGSFYETSYDSVKHRVLRPKMVPSKS